MYESILCGEEKHYIGALLSSFFVTYTIRERIPLAKVAHVNDTIILGSLPTSHFYPLWDTMMEISWKILL